MSPRAFGLCLKKSAVVSRIQMCWLKTLKCCIAFVCMNTVSIRLVLLHIRSGKEPGAHRSLYVLRLLYNIPRLTITLSEVTLKMKSKMFIARRMRLLKWRCMHHRAECMYNWRHLEWQVQKKFIASKQTNSFNKCNKFSYVIQMGLIRNSECSTLESAYRTPKIYLSRRRVSNYVF